VRIEDSVIRKEKEVTGQEATNTMLIARPGFGVYARYRAAWRKEVSTRNYTEK
jgi:hypothetical protein